MVFPTINASSCLALRLQLGTVAFLRHFCGVSEYQCTASSQNKVSARCGATIYPVYYRRPCGHVDQWVWLLPAWRFLLVLCSNHCSKMDRFELGAWERRTDGQTDGSQRCLMSHQCGGATTCEHAHANRQRKCAENYNKWHNKNSLFVKLQPAFW